MTQRIDRAPVPPPATPAKLHLDPERLALHAAGQLRPVERVLVETHLAFCPECVERLRVLLEPGARWLAEVASVPVAAGNWEALERRLDAAPAIPEGVSFPNAGVPGAWLPAAAVEELGGTLPALEWKGVATSRARYAILAEDAVADYQLLIVGLGGGLKFPDHIHLGNEEVVLLAGGYSDRYVHLDAGNYYLYEPGTEHGTVTDPDEVCWTLGLIQHGLHFRGLLGALQLLVDPVARRKWRRYRRGELPGPAPG
jgi:putative transcriptional regulator